MAITEKTITLPLLRMRIQGNNNRHDQLLYPYCACVRGVNILYMGIVNVAGIWEGDLKQNNVQVYTCSRARGIRRPNQDQNPPSWEGYDSGVAGVLTFMHTCTC